MGTGFRVEPLQGFGEGDNPGRLQRRKWLTGIEDVREAEVISRFGFSYDRAGNLRKERCLKTAGPSGGVGDRFVYDEHHRLTQAWLGVTDAQMSTVTNPGNRLAKQLVAEAISFLGSQGIGAHIVAYTIDEWLQPIRGGLMRARKRNSSG